MLDLGSLLWRGGLVRDWELFGMEFLLRYCCYPKLSKDRVVSCELRLCDPGENVTLEVAPFFVVILLDMLKSNYTFLLFPSLLEPVLPSPLSIEYFLYGLFSCVNSLCCIYLSGELLSVCLITAA